MSSSQITDMKILFLEFNLICHQQNLNRLMFDFNYFMIHEWYFKYYKNLHISKNENKLLQ